jgi:phosphotransferase system enzyme I (PtsI)
MGIAASPGIAIGPVYLYAREQHTVDREAVAVEQVEAEVERFEGAIAKAERDLSKIIALTREKLGEESATIFEAQLLMLRDQAVYQTVVETIRRDHCNAEYAVTAVMGRHRRLMEASSSEYLRERAYDLLDVEDRIIRHLRRGQILSAIDPHTIVVAQELTAADIILFSRRGIIGCVMGHGGPTSHVSIMARALGVPTIVGVHGITEAVHPGDVLILDGICGQVIANPGPVALEQYRHRAWRYQRLQVEDKALVQLPAETMDGHRVRLEANLEFREELPLLKEYGADGIGLFRTEMALLMQGKLSVSEDEQFETFRQVVAATAPQPTTLRVLDLGGDKLLPMAHREHNPFLGWRGIRLMLDKHDLLVPHLRAMLRASAFGPMRLLLPMVTTREEVQQFFDVLEEVKAALAAEGQPLLARVPVGIMVEVPATALMADQFAPLVDFFSIGTNDLTQYLLAVDRGNDLVAHLYQDLHPALLHLIRQVVEVARRHAIPVSLCGELATNPRAVPILVGLGLDTLSASPVYLPAMKRIIRSMRLTEGQALARAAVEAPDPQHVHTLLDQWLAEHGCAPLFFQQPAPGERPR